MTELQAYFAVGDMVNGKLSGFAFQATPEAIAQNELIPMNEVPVNIERRVDGVTIAKTLDWGNKIVLLQDSDDVFKVRSDNFEIGNMYELCNAMDNLQVITNRVQEIHRVGKDILVLVDELRQAYAVSIN